MRRLHRNCYCDDCKAYYKWYRETNAERIRIQRANYRQTHAENIVIQNAKARAKKLNVPFDLTAEDIIIPDTCPILGIPIMRNNGKRVHSDNSPSLDRLVPALGYVKGNVHVISYRANLIKNQGTLAEHLAVVEFMKKVSHKN